LVKENLEINLRLFRGDKSIERDYTQKFPQQKPHATLNLLA